MGTPVEARLGPIEQVHRVRRGLRRGQLIGAVSLASIAVLAWAFAAYRAYLAYTEYGPLLVGRWVTWPVVLGLVLAGGALWLAVRAWRTWHVRVRRHANGLAVLRGRRGRAMVWPDVRAVWSRAERTGLPGLSASRRLRLEVEANDGRRIRLDDSLEDFENLARAVKDRVYPLLLELYTSAFNQQQAIAFGPLRLSPGGLEDNPRAPLAWSEVRGAQLASGRLMIRTTRPGRQSAITLPAHRVPNVELCAQLIQEIGQTE
jgi:hypothetical protein